MPIWYPYVYGHVILTHRHMKTVLWLDWPEFDLCTVSDNSRLKDSIHFSVMTSQNTDLKSNYAIKHACILARDVLKIDVCLQLVLARKILRFSLNDYLSITCTGCVAGHSMWQLDGCNVKLSVFLFPAKTFNILAHSRTSVRLCELNLTTVSRTKRPHLSDKNFDFSRCGKASSYSRRDHKEGWNRQSLHLRHSDEAFILSRSERYESISTIMTLGKAAQFPPAAIFFTFFQRHKHDRSRV